LEEGKTEPMLLNFNVEPKLTLHSVGDMTPLFKGRTLTVVLPILGIITDIVSAHEPSLFDQINFEIPSGKLLIVTVDIEEFTKSPPPLYNFQVPSKNDLVVIFIVELHV
jgi:hypothetical protein